MQRRTPRKRPRTPWNKSTGMRFQVSRPCAATGIGSASGWVANRKRKAKGKLITDGRSATSDKTSSTSRAAVSAMRGSNSLC